MLAVLGNLTGLHLLTVYRNGPEQVSYDNVTLIPEPASVGLLVLGGAILMRRGRSRAPSHDR